MTEFTEQSIGVSYEQFRLLYTLKQNDGCSQFDLAKRLNINRSAVGRTLLILEKENLLIRQPHPVDKRLQLVFLTAAGKRVLQTGEKCLQKVEKNFLNSLSSADREALDRILNTN